MYQADLGRFFNHDRFAEKYYDYNPYQYALDNPIKYVDVNGDSVELVIGKPYVDARGKEHPFGHVALRVYNSVEGYDNVYDFGRYGAVRGLLNHTGDGILNVYNNSKSYLSEEQSIRSSVGYSRSTTVEEDKQIIDYYDNQIADGDSYSRRDNKNRKSYKLEDYDILTNNCCTISTDGLDQVGMNWLGGTFDPREALKSMERQFKELGLVRTEYQKGGITIVTYTPPVSNDNGKSGGQKYSEEPIPLIIEDN